MNNTSQISAFISNTTRERLERYTDSCGMKKGAVIEAALLHHLQALDELPLDLVVPAKLVLTRASFAEVTASLTNPAPATPAMTALMAGQNVEGFDG